MALPEPVQAVGVRPGHDRAAAAQRVVPAPACRYRLLDVIREAAAPVLPPMGESRTPSLSDPATPRRSATGSLADLADAAACDGICEAIENLASQPGPVPARRRWLVGSATSTARRHVANQHQIAANCIIGQRSIADNVHAVARSIVSEVAN